MGLVYKQIANIDADPSINFNNRAGFIPIGNTIAFTGKYDGQGFWIDDLHINRSTLMKLVCLGLLLMVKLQMLECTTLLLLEAQELGPLQER